MIIDIQEYIKQPFSLIKYLTSSVEKVDYKTINQHILTINAQETIEDLVAQTSKCFKSLIHYKLFAFVIQVEEELHIWSDPLLNRESLMEIIGKDFPSKDIGAMHYVGKRESNIINTFFHKPESVFTYSFSSINHRAQLYLIHDKRLSLEFKKASKTLATTFENTLKLILKINDLKKTVSMDPLTGCFNRRALKNILRQSINNAHRYKRDLSIVMLDIDHFKSINDTYGHLFGDIILKTLSHVIQSFIRQGDSLSRYGGEEFVIVLPETPLEIAIEITQRLKWKIENIPFKTPSQNMINVTASYGVASVSTGDDSESLLSEADTMLYLAKSNGRNCVMPSIDELHVKKFPL